MRFFLTLLVVLALSIPTEAQQPPKIPRIGYLSPTGDSNTPVPNVEAFRQGLRELGWKNILVEYRDVEGKPDRIPGLVTEFVQLKVDVLVLVPLTAIRAAKRATKTIPIVMVIAVMTQSRLG